jgi:hypothetical protein
VDISAAVREWREAATTVDALVVSEAGMADGQTVGALDHALEPVAQEYLADPVVAASYAMLEPSIALVELDKLVVFQRQINLTYAAELVTQVDGLPAASEQILDFCLGRNQEHPPVTRLQASPNTFVFQSISTDARFLGSALLDADQVARRAPQGHAHSAVVMFIGYGVNAVNVVDVDGRLVLNNGSHRAYALRAAGFTHTFAVVQNASREADLSVVPLVQQNKELYLENPRPPMLKDYFDPALVKQVAVPRRARQIKLQFGVEPLDAPA